MKYLLRKFIGKSWLWWLNVFVLQWLFIRLALEVDAGTDNVVDWRIIGLIVPLTGWMNNYWYVLRIKDYT